MSRCAVCGNVSLLPEIIGSSNLCKVCFMKVNGPFWKSKTYEKYDDAERKRYRALENAKKQNFPQTVIDDINAFFDAHEDNMVKCDACEGLWQSIETIGEVKLCKNCCEKIKASSWKKLEFESNENVEAKRKEILNLAATNGFSPIAIEGLSNYFNNKIQKGLIRIFESDNGQTLKVYETHCILVTEHEVFDVEEMEKAYGAVLRKQKMSNFLSVGSVEKIAKDVLTGNVAKAGKSFATSVAVESPENSV